MRIFLKYLFILLLTSMMIIGCSPKKEKVNNIKKSPTNTSENIKKSEPDKTISSTATVAAIGDILLHEPVYRSAATAIGYDFKPMFSEVKEMLIKPDFLIANQESMPGGSELGLSSYPIFNSPHEIVDNLIDTGVDLFSQANNHTLDKGSKGIESAINYYEQKNVPYVGMYKNIEDQSKLRIFEVNGIKLGVMAYTYGTNGIPVPEGKEYLVNLIDREKMKAEIDRLKTTSDIVIAVVHWGNEYQREPHVSQKELAQFMADNGVNIIFGSHPHVLQPMEWVTSSTGEKTLCVYSLGNFISNQKNNYKDIGGMAEVKITKIQTGKNIRFTYDDVRFYPTYVSKGNPIKYDIVPMETAPAFGLVSPTKDDILHFMMATVDGACCNE